MGYKVLIIIFGLVTLAGGMSLFSPHYKRQVAIVEKLDSGHATVIMELPRRTVAWGVQLGDQFLNSELAAIAIEIFIVNRSACEMSVMGSQIRVRLAKGAEAMLYSGTLGDFWTREYELLCNTVEHDCDLKFVLHLNFKDIGDTLPCPLKITASINDAM